MQLHICGFIILISSLFCHVLMAETVIEQSCEVRHGKYKKWLEDKFTSELNQAARDYYSPISAIKSDYLLSDLQKSCRIEYDKYMISHATEPISVDPNYLAELGNSSLVRSPSLLYDAIGEYLESSTLRNRDADFVARFAEKARDYAASFTSYRSNMSSQGIEVRFETREQMRLQRVFQRKTSLGDFRGHFFGTYAKKSIQLDQGSSRIGIELKVKYNACIDRSVDTWSLELYQGNTHEIDSETLARYLLPSVCYSDSLRISLRQLNEDSNQALQRVLGDFRAQFRADTAAPQGGAPLIPPQEN